MVSPQQLVDSAPAPTLSQLYAQWAKRQRNDLADLSLEIQLHQYWSHAVPEAVEEFQQSELGRRVSDAATDLLALRGQLLASAPGRPQSAVFESLLVHLTTGMDAASVHMVAELDLVRRMPQSQTLSPAAVADKARASAILPRRFASLHIAHFRHAADATSQLARRPALRRNAGFELDPGHFQESAGGVRPVRRLEDYELTYGDGSVGTVGDIPSQGPRLGCPAVHARVMDERTGATMIGLDAMWEFAVDAYVHAGLFDPLQRAAKHNELAAQMPGFQPQSVAVSL